MKPVTFMNNSGESVAALAKFYRVPPGRVLVVADDLDQPTAQVRGWAAPRTAEAGAGAAVCVCVCGCVCLCMRISTAKAAHGVAPACSVGTSRTPRAAGGIHRWHTCAPDWPSCLDAADMG